MSMFMFGPLVVAIDLNACFLFTAGMVVGALVLAVVKPRRKR